MGLNPISTIEQGAFTGLDNLQRLELSSTSLSSVQNGAFNGLGNLQILHLYRNQISSIESGGFEGLSSLESLQLYDNRITALTPGGFTGLAGLQELGRRTSPYGDGKAGVRLLLAANNFLAGEFPLLRADQEFQGAPAREHDAPWEDSTSLQPSPELLST